MGERKRTVVEVGALAPLDAKAARVLGGGETWKPFFADKRSPGFVREESGTLPTRKTPAAMVDLTGQRFGRFVVKGLADKSGPNRWVVRCDCGAYEHRKRAVLTAPDTSRLMCSDCDHLNEMRAGRHSYASDISRKMAPRRSP